MLETRCPELLLVPKEEAPFLVMWKPLLDMPHLYVPIGTSGSPTGRCVRGEKALRLCESVSVPNRNGQPLGLAYTDPRVFLEWTVYAEVATVEFLEMCLFSPKIAGVAFNAALTANPPGPSGAMPGSSVPALTQETRFSCTVWESAIVRLLGFVRSPDPFAAGGYSHVELAQEALRRDHLTVAFHHATAARDGGEPLAGYVFPELEALFHFGFVEGAAAYLEQFEKRGCDLRSEIYRSRILTLTGKPNEAAERLLPLCGESQIESQVHLELGRAYLGLGKARDAVDAFERSLLRDSERVEAWMGRGVSLLQTDEEGNDVEVMNEAIDAFSEVTRREGDHRAEAWNRMASVYLNAGMWSHAEAAASKSLTARQSVAARRHLVLALHGQGKVAEARRFYP